MNSMRSPGFWATISRPSCLELIAPSWVPTGQYCDATLLSLHYWRRHCHGARAGCGSGGRPVAKRMKGICYNGYRFPPAIIHQAIWLYLRFTLSLRDVEDLLAERGITVSYESIRRWVIHFGPMIAADLRKRRPKPHTSWLAPR